MMSQFSSRSLLLIDQDTAIHIAGRKSIHARNLGTSDGLIWVNYNKWLTWNHSSQVDVNYYYRAWFFPHKMRMPYLSFHVKVKQMAAIIIAVANFLDYTQKEVVLVLMMIIYFSDISFCFFFAVKGSNFFNPEKAWASI